MNATKERTELDQLILKLDKDTLKKLSFSKSVYEFVLEQASKDPEIKHMSHSYHDGRHYVSISTSHDNPVLKKYGALKTFFAYGDSIEVASLKAYLQWKGVLSDVPF